MALTTAQIEDIERRKAEQFELDTTADWIVLRVSASPTSRYFVEGVNLCHAAGTPNREFRWHVGDDSVFTWNRFDISRAEITPEAAFRRERFASVAAAA